MSEYTEESADDLIAIYQLTNAIMTLPARAGAKSAVSRLLERLKLPAEHADWLCGNRPIHAAPGFVVERAEQRALIKPRAGIAVDADHPNSKFVRLEWGSTGDEILIPWAAEEAGMSVASLRSRLALGKGVFSVQRNNPEHGNDDSIIIRRVASQPSLSERRYLLKEGRARLEALRSQREALANRFKVKRSGDQPAKPALPKRPLGPHQGRRY